MCRSRYALGGTPTSRVKARLNENSETVDDAAFEQGLVSVGVPADYAQLMVILFQAVRAGAAAKVDPTIERVLGRAPRSLEQYAADHASVWAVPAAASR